MYNLPTSAKITVNKEAAGSDTVKLNSSICIRSTETDREEKRVLKYNAYREQIQEVQKFVSSDNYIYIYICHPA